MIQRIVEADGCAEGTGLTSDSSSDGIELVDGMCGSGNVAPIDRLPNEVLLDIFTLYGIIEGRSRNTAWEGLYLGNDAYTVELGHRNHWVSLMLVCRFWRELALATPYLWQEIDVRSSTKWLQLALQRSRDAHLTLIFHPGSARAAVPLVLPHAQRIRRLILAHPFTKRKVELPFFLPLLRTPMTNLYELALPYIRVQPETERGYAVLPLSQKHFPGLRVLHLPGFAVRWVPSVVARLRCLSLQTSTSPGPLISADRFLDILETCESLEDLQLRDGYIFSAIDVEGLDDAQERIVRLPRLRKLVLGDQPAVTSWLLSRLDLPLCTSLHIIGKPPTPGAPPTGKIGFASFLPRDHSGRHALPMPLLSTVTHGSITVISRDSSDFTVTSDAAAHVTIEPVAQVDGNRALVEFSELFAGAALRDLQVFQGISASTDFHAWDALFRAFPKIRSLILVRGLAHDSPAELLQSLGGGGRSADVDVGADNPWDDRASSAVLPALSSLAVEGAWYRPGLVGSVLVMLNRRATSGLPPLKSLRFRVIGTREELKQDVLRELGAHEHALRGTARRVDISYSVRSTL
ncbi:hypothetical protein C8Q77DRAFT_132732 [Trametes polyzona]|nr:hypothetical protein C8Q77DRAFT_132732 [Trametes polyzona]